MPSYCGQWTRVGQVDQETLVVPLRCRSWACPVCGPRNKRRLLRRMISSPATTLITLTCSRRTYTSSDDAYRALSAAVPNLVKRIHRRFPSAPFQYLLVWERTKAGWPHAHLLCRTSYLPQRWLSRQWAELAGSPVVDIRRLSNARGASRYVSKYLSKDPFVPSPMKRYRASRAFFSEPGGLLGLRQRVGGVWTIYTYPIDIVLYDFPYALYTREETPHGTVVCRPKPQPAGAGRGGTAPPPQEKHLKGPPCSQGAWGGAPSSPSWQLPYPPCSVG